jgi:2-succinyl-5-enolpyruvyl-6-hydroxy-3-cyclohexene-1-carboxylate synthase
MAKAAQRPVVLICTSGTAGANYYPAIIEAFHSHVPLIVLTADRPPELQVCGAPQTIDQRDLYGRFVKRSVTLGVPDKDVTDVSADWTREVGLVYEAAVDWPQGPVHINMPFREPLLPDAEAPIREWMPDGRRIRVGGEYGGRSAPAAPDSDLAELANLIRQVERGLIIAGPMTNDARPALLRLAAKSGYPILTDIASHLRFGPEVSNTVIAGFDLLIRNDGFAMLMEPELIIRFGGLPTSKRLNLWLAGISPRAHYVIADSQPIADPYGSATAACVADPMRTAAGVIHHLGDYERGISDYAHHWDSQNRRAWDVVENSLVTGSEVFEGQVVRDVFRVAPLNTYIVLGNSMPIRWADRYAAVRDDDVRVVFNRGVNGIDGVVSTAVGVAAFVREPVVLVIGDISFLHDLGGLLPVAKTKLKLTIVLLNNDGGGIFSYLPLAKHDQIFEPLVAMPHGRTFEPIAKFYGIDYTRVDRADGFVPAFGEAMRRAGTTLIEVRSHRRHNIAVDRSVDKAIGNLTLD